MIIASDIVKISEQIESKLGLYFPENRLKDLKKAIQSALPELGFGNNFDSFYQALCADSLNQIQFDILALHLTVGETYFFREDTTLQVLKKVILPSIIEERSTGKKDIRIWSAGCCTGEEAYTIAILLSELLPDIESWNITILGSDINRKFIQKAINGRYTQWSFRETPVDVLNRYFKKVGQEFEIIPRIKKMVTFSYINLADDKYPSHLTNTDAMDIILCRNVLMYFSVEQRIAVINRFAQSLVSNSWFITSPVEVSNEDYINLRRVMINDAILYRKGAWDDEKTTAVFSSNIQKSELEAENQKYASFYQPENQKVYDKVVPPAYFVSTHIEDQKDIFVEPINEDLADLQKAEQYYKQGAYENALELFKKLYKKKPTDNHVIYFLAKSSANLGYHAEARSWCEILIDMNKMNANYHYLLATILLELNEPTQAEQALNKVLYLDSQHVLAHFVIGNYYRNQGNVKMARKHYQNIMKLIEVLHEDFIIPESEDLTVGRMKELVTLFR